MAGVFNKVETVEIDEVVDNSEAAESKEVAGVKNSKTTAVTKELSAADVFRKYDVTNISADADLFSKTRSLLSNDSERLFVRECVLQEIRKILGDEAYVDFSAVLATRRMSIFQQ